MPTCASLALAGSTFATLAHKGELPGVKSQLVGSGHSTSFAIIISVDGGGKIALDLDLIRKDIDQVDEEIVALLEKRMDLVSQVVAYKRKAVLDTGREQAVLGKGRVIGEKIQTRNHPRQFT